MSRYLTPSRIGLLALTCLYSESVVSSEATIPILSFLCSHVITKGNSAEGTTLEQDGSILTIENLQAVIFTQSSSIPGRSLWDLLLNKLWRIDSLDALHGFFDSLFFVISQNGEVEERHVRLGPDPILGRISFSRVSPLGAFIRRAQVEFTRLQFHGSVSLWNAFVAYRAPTLAQWKKRNPSAGQLSFDSNLKDEQFSPDTRLVESLYGRQLEDGAATSNISPADVERLLEFQIDRMQRESTSPLVVN